MPRLLLALTMWLCAMPAHGYYFIKTLEVDPNATALAGDQMRSAKVVVREEPCSRPEAAMSIDVWALVKEYSLTDPVQWGFKLVSFPLPKPTVLPDGSCETQHVPTAPALTITAPPAGVYNVAYFLRVDPALGCPPSEPGCYEDSATSYGNDAQQAAAVPFRQFEILPHVYAWKETLRAIEYYHSGLDHYFLTAWPAEIAALDDGIHPGWQRTGESFDTWTSGSGGRSGVCRFYGVVAGKGTHFYTAHAGECTALMDRAPWQYESLLGYVQLPGGLGCFLAPRPLYRLYNAGMGGAPNHRYTTSLSIRAAMVAKGWISEGYGDLGVIGCIP